MRRLALEDLLGFLGEFLLYVLFLFAIILRATPSAKNLRRLIQRLIIAITRYRG
jgi:hypothetical protein